MKPATITETKNNLSALLDLVRAGESILILDRDVPVARLVPVGSSPDDAVDLRLLRLERAGVVRRGPRFGERPVASEPVPLREAVDAVQLLVEERGRSFE